MCYSVCGTGYTPAGPQSGHYRTLVETTVILGTGWISRNQGGPGFLGRMTHWTHASYGFTRGAHSNSTRGAPIWNYGARPLLKSDCGGCLLCSPRLSLVVDRDHCKVAYGIHLDKIKVKYIHARVRANWRMPHSCRCTRSRFRSDGFPCQAQAFVVDSL